MVAKLVNIPIPAELTHAVLRPILVSMLRSGITGVVDAGSSGIDGLVQAAAEVGIRAAIGPSLADLWHDSSGRLVRQADADELLTNASAFIARHDGAGQGRIRALVSAVQTMACSDELLSAIAATSASAAPRRTSTPFTAPKPSACKTLACWTRAAPSCMPAG